MMQHLDCGTHKRAIENETLFDKAAQEYAEQLEGQSMEVPVVSTVSTRAGLTDMQPMGWALSHVLHRGLGSQQTKVVSNYKV